MEYSVFFFFLEEDWPTDFCCTVGCKRLNVKEYCFALGQNNLLENLGWLLKFFYQHRQTWTETNINPTVKHSR